MPAFGGVPATFYFSDAATNTVANLVVTDHRSSGTAAANYGSGILFSGQDASGNPEQIASVAGVWTVATNSSEESAIAFFMRRAGGALTKRFQHSDARTAFMYGTITSPTAFGIGTFETNAADARVLVSSTLNTAVNGWYVTCNDTNRVIEMVMYGDGTAGTFFGVSLAGNGFILSNRILGIGTFAAQNMVLGTNDIAQMTFISSAGITANKVLCTGMATSLTAANNLAPDIVGNTVIVTGNTQINLIANTNRPAGTLLTLIFTGTPTVKNNQATSGANQKILLNGGVDFVAAANNTLTFVNDGTEWIEIGRKV